MNSNNTPLVSVVMPSYNGSEHIHAAIFSVLGQKYSNLELIVVDDGSTDTTKEIVAFLQEQNSKIRLIENSENKWIAKTLNRGLENAHGKYIAILDQDDAWIDQYKLQKQVNFLEKDSTVGFLGTNNIVKKRQGEVASFSIAERPASDECIKESLLARNPFCHATVMYRNMYEKIGGYPENILYAPDYAYRLKAGVQTKFANISDYTTLYNSHLNNTSTVHRLAQTVESLQLSWNYRNDYPNALKCLSKKTYTKLYSLLGEYMDTHCPFLKEEIRRLLGKPPRYVHNNHEEFLESIIAVNE